MFAEPALAALETLVNAYLALDPEIKPRLARLHGKVIGLEFSGFDSRIYFVPTPDRLLVQGQCEGGPDTLLRGSPVALASLSRSENSRGELFSGRVEVEGDTALAQRFGRILAEIDIDWEEHFSHLVGDVPAHQAGRLVRGLRDWLGSAARTLEMDLGDYLQEEARLSPRSEELKDFAGQVDRLRDDVERLEARVHRLQQRLASR